MITSEELKELSGVDIRTVNESDLKDLVDVTSGYQNDDQPINNRIEEFIEQVGNPYCYIDHGMIVKISFIGKKKMEDCMRECAFC